MDLSYERIWGQINYLQSWTEDADRETAEEEESDDCEINPGLCNRDDREGKDSGESNEENDEEEEDEEPENEDTTDV